MKRFVLLFIGILSLNLASSQTCLLDTVNVRVDTCLIDSGYVVDITMGMDSINFELSINSDFFGNFIYDSLAVHLDSVPDSGMSQDTFLFCQEGIDSCCVSLLVNNPCYCGFSDLVYDVISCDAVSNTYFLVLDFETYNNSDGFNLIGTGGINGSFQYGDLPVTIGPLQANGPTYSFSIIDHNDVTCFTLFDVDVVDCGVINACSISNVLAEPLDCQIDGTFSANVTFDVTNPGPFGFTIQGNGVNYGTFAYGQSVYTVGPIVGDCSTLFEFQVLDLGDPLCTDSYTFTDPVCCTVVPCELGPLEFSPVCDNNEWVALNLNFTFGGNTASTFEVFIDGMSLGVFAYTDLPLFQSLGALTIVDDFVDIVVVDSDDPNCTSEILNEEVDCMGICEISNVVAEPQNFCDGDFFLVDVVFNVANAASDSFTITGNGTNYGTFAYGQIFYTVGPILADCMTFLEFIVTDKDEPSCNDSFTLPSPVCCSLDDCNIYDLTVSHSDCDASGQFTVTLDFLYENEGNAGFSITGNGVDYGDFVYGNGPFTIGPLDGDCITIYEFVVTDNEDSDCTEDFEFLEPICCNMCSIYDLEIAIGDCNVEDEFFVTLNFLFENEGGNGFTIMGNGINYGVFQYGNGPFTLGPLEGDCTTIYEFAIADVDDPDCNGSIALLEPVCCGNDCSIYDVTIMHGDCNAQGEFFVTLDFLYENEGTDGFTVSGNGLMHGTFPYGTGPYTIGPLAGDCTTVYEFVVADVLDPDCNSFAAFLEPICCPPPDSCNIYDVTIVNGDCNVEDEFFVTLDFLYENEGVNGFSIVGNGTDYGDFVYGNGPFVLGPLAGDCSTLYEFVVTDNEFPDCSGSASFMDPICCDPELCVISGLEVSAEDCNLESEFFATVNFTANNQGSLGFTISGNGTNYGNFDYGNAPYSIGPLEGDCTTIYEFVISDIELPDCTASFEFLEPICCDNDCDLFDVEVTASDCNMDENFFANISFLSEETGSEGFTIMGNGVDYGNFEYGMTSYEIGPLAGDCTTIYEFVLTDTEFNDCTAEVSFLEPICCNDDDCEISELSIELLSCNQEVISFVLDFNFVNNTGDTFDVFSRDGIFGTFNYADLPITITDFPNTGFVEEFVQVCDNDNQDCCAEIEFLLEPCESEDCELGELELEFIECNPDSIWFTIGLNLIQEASDSFELEVNNIIIGTYAYDNLPLVIGVLNNAMTFQFLFTDNDNADCQEDGTLFIETDCSVGNEEIFWKDTKVYKRGNQVIVESGRAIDEVSLYNIYGAQITTSSASYLQLENIPTGIYLVKVQSQDSYHLRKIYID